MQGLQRASCIILGLELIYENDFRIFFNSFTICSDASGIRDRWASFANGKVLNTIVRKASHFLDVYYLLNIRHTIQKVFVFSYYSLLGKVDN